MMLLSRTTNTTWGLHNTYIHALPHTLSLYHFLCDTLLLIFVLHLSPCVFHSFSRTLPLWKREARGGGGHSAAVQPKAKSFGMFWVVYFLCIDSEFRFKNANENFLFSIVSNVFHLT